MFFPFLYVCFQFVESTEINDSSLEAWKRYHSEIHMFRDITVFNCSPSVIEHQTCLCKTTHDECIVCCNHYCCNCEDCWSNEWQLTTMTQVSISILFLLGIIGIIIVFLKTCNRHNDDNTSFSPIRRRTLERLQDRPPAYNEIYGAPPLYTAPQNRVSMLDAPPVYPGPPQSQERIAQGNICSPPITHHV